MTDPFEACWLRIDRAEAHRKASADVWNEWLKHDPYYCVLNHEGEGKFVALAVQKTPTPPEMGVLMGEWLYNLRCVLDYAVYATAVCDSGKNPPPGHGQLQFPCYFTEKSYRDNEYRLKPLSEFHRTRIIERVQPYRNEDPDASALGWLHKLARIDRHRRLTFMLGWIAEASPLIMGPAECSIEVDLAKRVVVDGEAEIARFKLTPWQDGWEVQINPRAGIDPEIGDWADSRFASLFRYNDRLKAIRIAVESVVAALEYDCTGDSRQAKLLSESWRADSDARREPAR